MRLPGDTDRIDARRLDAWAAAHRPRVWRTAYGLLGDADQAEDIAQEALLRLHRNPPELPGTRLGAWLHTVTVNLCRDALRVRVRRGTPLPLDAVDRSGGHGPPHHDRDVVDPGADIDGRRASEALDRALARLTPEQERAIRLRYLEGMSYKDIADQTDSAVGTVASRVFRGLQRLGLELEPRYLEVLK